jgi:hypothetical protein
MAIAGAHALGRIIVSFRDSLQTAVYSLLGLTSLHARSEVVCKKPARRLPVDAPFCFRWRVASSRWLPLALQLTMIRLVAPPAPGRAPSPRERPEELIAFGQKRAGAPGGRAN